MSQKEIDELEDKIDAIDKRIQDMELTFSWIKGIIFGGSLITGGLLWIWEQIKTHTHLSFN